MDQGSISHPVPPASFAPRRLTRAERRLGFYLLGSAVVYGGAGLVFWVFPAWCQWVSGWLGEAVGLETGRALPASLWHPLGVSMMFTISCCAAMAGIDPRRNRPFVLPLIVSKLASTAVAIGWLLTGHGLASTLGVVATDLPIAGVTIAMYAAAVRSVNGSWLRGDPPL